MNIIKRIIKNKMKKVLEIFLNLSYNICVCERVRVKNKSKNNNKMDKKYILVSCGGANSEIRQLNQSPLPASPFEQTQRWPALGQE